MPDSSELFISYARRDAKEIAIRLGKDLQMRGFRAWLDTSRIAGGASWSLEIEQSLERCQVVLALLSEGSFRSEICRAEQLRALRRGKRVIPLLIQSNADRPLHLEHLNYRDFSDSARYVETFELLVADISTGQLVALPEKHRQTYVTVPPLPTNFIPRPEELEKLRRAVIADDTRRQIALTALRGMGGIGKSVLAQALCKDEVVQAAFPDGVIWVMIGREPGDLVRQMREVGKVLGDAAEHYDTPDASANRLRTRLQDKAVLIVLDDVWEARHVEPFRMEAPRCRTLFTTRDGNIGMSLGAEEVKLGVLTPAQSAELLCQWAGHDDPAFLGIAKRVGYLPLALKLAGARLREGMTGSEWLERFRHVAQMKLGRYAKDPHQNLEACFDISLERLPEKDCLLYHSLGIFPQAAPILQAVITRLWCQIDPQVSEFDCNEIIAELARQALLEITVQKKVVLHDLLYDYTRSRLGNRVEATNNQLLAAYNPQQQPWFAIQDDGYLYRRLAYHLRQAARSEELRQLLLNSRWLQAKLNSTDIASLIADYDLIADDPFLRTVQGAILLSAHILARDKTQLAGQLTGRLLSYQSPAVEELLQTVGNDKSCSRLRAFSPSLTPPGGPLLLTLGGHAGGVIAVAVTPDARLALTGSDDLTVKVWDLSCGMELRTLSGHGGWVLAVEVTPDGRQALTASDDGTIRIWDLESGTELHILRGHTARVNSVQVSPDGRLALTASHDRTVKIWDLERRALRLTLVGHADGVRAVALTPDARRALTASDDQTLKLWDLDSGNELCTMKGHNDRVRSLALTPDGKRAITASADHTIKMWDLINGREVGTLIENIRGVTALAVTPDGEQFLTCSGDQAVKIWELGSGVALRTLGNHVGRVNGLTVTRDGRRVLTASDDETVKVWDLECRAGVTGPTSHSARVNTIVVTRDGKRALSASWDQTVKVWDMRTGVKVCTLVDGIRGVTALALTPDGKRVLTGSAYSGILIWDIEHGTKLSSLEGYRRTIRAMAVTPDGKLVLATSDEMVRLWLLDSGEELGTLEGHTGSVMGVAVTPDGRRAVTVSDDQTIKTWDLESCERLDTFVGHAGGVKTVALTPDGRRAITGSVDRTVKVWDLENGKELHTFRSHIGPVRAVTVTGDGKRLVSVSDDQTLKVWNLESGQLVAAFSGDGGLTACAVAPDCSTIIAADALGTVHFLRLEERS